MSLAFFKRPFNLLPLHFSAIGWCYKLEWCLLNNQTCQRILTKNCVICSLFSGAFGVVHRCVEKATGKVFVAKFIDTPTAADKQAVRNEVGVMTQLHHQKLITLHDAFEDRKEMCLIMELWVLNCFFTCQENKKIQLYFLLLVPYQVHAQSSNGWFIYCVKT